MSDTPLQEAETQEPTIDWLIDQLCPESSPLIDFNKKRLKDLVDRASLDAGIATLKDIRDSRNICGEGDEYDVVWCDSCHMTLENGEIQDCACIILTEKPIAELEKQRDSL